MKIILESPINRYYVQTLSMIFFPGEHFGQKENEIEDAHIVRYCKRPLSLKERRKPDDEKTECSLEKHKNIIASFVYPVNRFGRSRYNSHNGIKN